MAFLNITQKVIISLIIIILLSLAVISLTDNSEISDSFFGGAEVFSPSDWIKESQIKVYKNQVILDIEDASWAGFTNTNSMDPFIDESANAIEISPKSPESIKIGDVISYQTGYGVIIHRVVGRGIDDKGYYYIVKGDNNRFNDPYKIRFDNIVGVVVAVIY